MKLKDGDAVPQYSLAEAARLVCIMCECNGHVGAMILDEAADEAGSSEAMSRNTQQHFTVQITCTSLYHANHKHKWNLNLFHRRSM